jgi:hypothetical protein
MLQRICRSNFSNLLLNLTQKKFNRNHILNKQYLQLSLIINIIKIKKIYFIRVLNILLTCNF